MSATGTSFTPTNLLEFLTNGLCWFNIFEMEKEDHKHGENDALADSYLLQNHDHLAVIIN